MREAPRGTAATAARGSLHCEEKKRLTYFVDVSKCGSMTYQLESKGSSVFVGAARRTRNHVLTLVLRATKATRDKRAKSFLKGLPPGERDQTVPWLPGLDAGEGPLHTPTRAQPETVFGCVRKKSHHARGRANKHSMHLPSPVLGLNASGAQKRWPVSKLLQGERCHFNLGSVAEKRGFPKTSISLGSVWVDCENQRTPQRSTSTIIVGGGARLFSHEAKRP